MQPLGTPPAQAVALEVAEPGIGEVCVPTGTDDDDIATFDGHTLRGCDVVEVFGRDGITPVEPSLPSMSGCIEQHPSGIDTAALADRRDAVSGRAEARHRAGRISVVELVV